MCRLVFPSVQHMLCRLVGFVRFRFLEWVHAVHSDAARQDKRGNGR